MRPKYVAPIVAALVDSGEMRRVVADAVEAECARAGISTAPRLSAVQLTITVDASRAVRALGRAADLALAVEGRLSHIFEIMAGRR